MQRRSPSPITLEPLGRAWLMVVLFHGLLGAGIWLGLTSIHWETAVPSAPGEIGKQTAEEVLDWQSPSLFRFEGWQPAKVESEVPPTEPDPPATEVLKEEMVPTVAESADVMSTDLSGPSGPSEANAGSVGSQRPANRFITLSRLTSDLAEPPSPRRSELRKNPVPTLMDITKMNGTQLYPSRAGTAGSDLSSGLDEVDAAVQEAFLRNWVAPPVGSVDPDRRSAHLEVSIAMDGTVLGTMLARPSGSDALDSSIYEAAEKVKKIPLSLPAGFGKPFYELQVNFQID